jgi:large subunit ribosomal protein L25
MNEVSLTARKREGTGKKIAKAFRREGRLPAVIYGGGEEPTPLTLDHREFETFLRKHRGESVVINLEVEGGEAKKALLRDIQRDYIKNSVIHADFQQILMTDRITTTVSVVLTGDPVGVKRDGGVLEQALREVEIQCLASEIPEHLEVDVADMIIGETLHISDLTFENVDITTDGGVSVVSVLAPMAEEVVEEEEEGLEQEEPEIIGRGQDDEEEAEEEAE